MCSDSRASTLFSRPSPSIPVMGLGVNRLWTQSYYTKSLRV